MSDQDEILDLSQLLPALQSGDLSTILPILTVFSESEPDLSLLRQVAESVATYILPLEWSHDSTTYSIFITASLPFPEIFAILDPLFRRPDLREFSTLSVNIITANFLSSPDHLLRLLLYVTTRVVQYDPTFYN
jgi:hypothetical protein